MNKSFLTKYPIAVVTLISAGLIGLSGCGTQPTGPTAGGPSTPAPLTTPTPTTIDCNSTAPESIVSGVYDVLEKTTSYTRQEWQFNISIAVAGSKKTINVTGWSPQRDAIYALISSTASGCTTEGNNFKVSKDLLDPRFRVIASCQPGTFACGDVCLPNGETCKLTGATETVVPSPTVKTSTESNSNSNSAPQNTNSNSGK
ncbi:MAG: hypothetical protein IPM59_12240 [Chloracidobacterium sp.]|nr:hypothetical protein [Chloracidobacterium sp.]